MNIQNQEPQTEKSIREEGVAEKLKALISYDSQEESDHYRKLYARKDTEMNDSEVYTLKRLEENGMQPK